MSNRLLSRLGAACLHVALSVGALSASSAAPSYYRARRGAYGSGPHQYLADNGMQRLSASTIAMRRNQAKDKGIDKTQYHDFHFEKRNAVRELVIVDRDVQDKQLIFRQIKPGVDIVEVKQGRGGVEALTAILRKYTNLDAVHIVSHAESGSIFIGGERVDQAALQEQLSAFAVINQAIREGGDLMLYGCDLAKDQKGDAFLEIIRENSHVDVAASLDKTGNPAYDGDWDLEVVKGDIEAAALPGSIALNDFTGTLQFSGTIDFSNIKSSGQLYTTNPAINAEVWENTAHNYALVIDGVNSATYIGSTYDARAYFGAYGAETSVVLRFSENETFDPSSIKLFNWSGTVAQFTITSDKGGAVTSALLAASGGNQTLDISSLPTGTSALTITSNSSFWGSVDDFEVNNLRKVPANTPPVASSVSVSGTKVVGETLTASYTFTDADGDAESGSSLQWYRYDDGAGSGKTLIAGVSSKTYTLQSADQGKYINFAVSPSDGSSTGPTVESAIQGPVTPALKATITSQTNIACKGGNTGSITAAGSGGTGPYTYSWSPAVGTGATATGLTAGTYTVTVIDANGKTDQATTTITQPAAVLSSAIGYNDVSCYGGTNGAAAVFVSGGTPSYTYSWAPSGGNAAAAEGLAAGTYRVTVTDANDCQHSRVVTIDQPSAVLSATASQTNVSCNGGTNGSASVTVSGGTGPYTYSWTPSGGNAATATGLAAGTYTVTVTDDNSCQLSQSFTIKEPAALSVTASQTDVSCNGGTNGSATVNVTGGTGLYTYSWAPSGGNAATATGLAAGTYTVTVTDDNSCQLSQNFTIEEPVALSATMWSTPVSCNGGANGSATVSVSGGMAPYTYYWSSSTSKDATATGLAAGKHTVTITDANACVLTKEIIVTQPTVLWTSPSQTNVSCHGGTNGSASVTVSGGTGPYTYSWAPSGGNAATATGLAAGTYTVTVTDDKSCQRTQSFTIKEPAALSATASQTDVSCNGDTNGSATVNVTGGTGPYTYSWAPSGGNAATATGLATGTYTVTVTDDNSCQLSQSFTIQEPSALTTNTTQTNNLCNGGADGYAAVEVFGGTAPYAYSWAPSGGTGSEATGLAAGTYTVSVTDAKGCGLSRTFYVTEPNQLDVTSTQTEVTTRGGTDGSATVVPTGGTYPYIYSWSPSGGNAATASELAAGTYTCTITDGNGCIITEEVTITELNSPPVASALSISGALSTGQLLTGSYTYTDADGDAQSGSTLKWYRSTDGAGSSKTVISGASGLSYSLTADDVGKFISFEVTPNDGIASGSAIESALYGPVNDGLSAVISLADAYLIAGETTTVTITFNRTVWGFTNADLTVEGGTLSAVASSDGGVTWVATFTPDEDLEKSDNKISIDMTGMTDADGVAGAGEISSSAINIDTRRPVAAIVLSDNALRAGETAIVSFTFNEVVAGFALADITAENGTISSRSSVDDITFTATFTPDANVEKAVNRISIDLSAITDEAGNTGSGTTESANFAIDTKAPEAPGALDLDAMSDSGDSDSDNLTNVTTPAIGGEAEAMSSVTLLDGAVVIGTTTTDINGKWFVQTTTPLSEGTHDFTARAADPAGNESGLSNMLTVIVDLTAPTTPPAPVLATTSDSGASDSDNLTSITTPVLGGTAEPASAIVVRSDRDGELATMVSDESGAWEFTAPVLTQGVHAITLVNIDAAGNESAASSALQLTIDVEEPIMTDIGNQTVPIGGLTGSLPFTINDNVTAPGNLTLEVTTSNSAVVPEDGIVVGGADDARTVEVAGASSGVATVTITLTDGAGNQSTGSFTVTVNTAPMISGTPPATVDEGVIYAFDPIATDADGDVLSFSIQNKPAWASFNTETGSLTGIPGRDNVSITGDITITVTDGTASTTLEPFEIEVIYVNASPAGLLLSSTEVDENQPEGTLVGTFTTEDSDADDIHTYSLVAGAGSADNAMFYINGDALYTTTSFDAEVRGTYQIRVQTSDMDGGTFEKQFEIRVQDVEDARVYIPNLFSPNGDGSNDVFRVRANGVAEIVLRIFNRWGDVVFQTADVQNATETGWNGNYEGKELPSGTYIWQMNGRFSDGTPILYDGKNTGNITLIR